MELGENGVVGEELCLSDEPRCLDYDVVSDSADCLV